jgi:hypothetical protein
MQERLGPVEQADAGHDAFAHGLVQDRFEERLRHQAVVEDGRIVLPIADRAGRAAQIAVAENVDVEAEPRPRGGQRSFRGLVHAV